jgi:hypothetical protein
MAALNFRRRQTRRWWYAGATFMAVAFFAVFFVVGATADNSSGCDFSPANNGVQNCAAPLTGSTFAGGDGNLLTSPTTFGTTDWQSVGINCTSNPPVGCGIDLPSGTTDNSFGQGTKTDNSAVSVVSGSIPPNKSDLTRFYEASEVGSNSDNFLYLAFERSNVLGTVNMNFEINQKTQPDLTVVGAKTLNRTAGDLLVTYDFTNGGGRPTIAILRWLTSATSPSNIPGFSTNVCFSANTFPCWGDQKVLDGTDSIAAVNNLDAVSDPIGPNAPRSQAALTFGETAIDLTAAGVFPSGTCTAFGSTMVTSRSSASFTSEVKDFIAPIPVNISNCGSIKIIKQTDPRNLNQNFGYTASGGSITPTSFKLNDQSALSISSISTGTATATVTTTTADGFSTAGDKFGVTISGSNSMPSVDGNYTATAVDSTHFTIPLATAVTTAGTAAGTVTTNTEVYPGLQAGAYTVTEGTEPSGFSFESLHCTNNGTPSDTGVVSVVTASITLAPGDAWACTYVNKQNTASLKTHVSATAVSPGTGVTDTATVTGSNTSENPSSPPNVNFYLCSGTTTGCSSTSNSVGSAPLGNGSGGVSTATSSAVNTSTNPLAAGNYCFGASWAGDSNYPGTLTDTGTSATNLECFTVSQIATTVVTTPSVGQNGSTTFGNTGVTDSATIDAAQDGGGAITGSVTFFICNPTQVATNGGTCSTGGTQVGSPVTNLVDQSKTPPEAIATSSAYSAGVNATGTWCWRAVYDPGTNTNYTGNSDASSTECFTVTDTTTSTSAQTWYPNDSASVSAHSTGDTVSGTLSIQLYSNADCGASEPVGNKGAVSGQSYSSGDKTNQSTITVSSSKQTTFGVDTTNQGNYSWLVTFTSDNPNVSGSSHCESSDLTISN